MIEAAGAAGAASTSTTDPVLALLTGAVAAALVGLLGGLLGAWLQSRREHKRWVRERRYEAFVRAYAVIKAFDLNFSRQMKIASEKDTELDDPRIAKLFEEADELYTTVSEVLAPSVVLGPDSVGRLIVAMQFAYERGERNAFGNAEREFVEAARKVLKIRG